MLKANLVDWRVRVQLADFDRRHMASTLEWMNDAELMRLLGRARPIGEEEHRRWFEGLAGRRDCRYFAVETLDGARHVGNVWLWDIDGRHRRAEVRVVVGRPEATDRGIGTEAIVLIARHAFDTLTLHRVYAYVLAINPRARRAFEKAGFRTEGLLRGDRWTGDEYVDVHVLGRLKDDPA
jgi:RimJ/RimL family protein N-acetyltransferase